MLGLKMLLALPQTNSETPPKSTEMTRSCVIIKILTPTQPQQHLKTLWFINQTGSTHMSGILSPSTQTEMQHITHRKLMTESLTTTTMPTL